MKPYYYVYNYANKAPIIRHATLAKAQSEAERLAVKHPGLCFEILKCVGLSSASKASTFWADGGEPQEESSYRMLIDGELICEGDEVCFDGNWIPSIAIGKIVVEHLVGKYRRKIK